MKDVATLKDLMIYELQSLYEAEKVWSVTLKENGNYVTNKDLKTIFEKGSKTAFEHAGLLKKMLSDLHVTALAKRNIVADGLVKEIREVVEDAADAEVVDAGIIVTHQCMNHYMIAKYGTVASYARLLQEEEVANLLHKIMEQEKIEDEELSTLAEAKINVRAKAALIQ